MFDDSARLRLLHELGMAFAAHTDLDELCQLVAARCAEVLRAQGASILLVDPRTNELYFPYVANADPDTAARLSSMRFPADRGIAGYAVTHGTAVRVDDATTDSRFYHGVDERSGATTRTVLAAPLKSESQTIGVLQVVNRIGGARFGDDDLGFLEAIAGSVAVAVENAHLLAQTRAQLIELQRATEERAALEALRRELDIARDIQRSILPATYPALPRHPEIDLFATMLPAREIGGDFYDFFLLDDEHLGMVVGDVSGKGMPAALFMAVTRTLVKATALSGLPPAACLHRVHRLLLAENASEMFVTLFYAVIDLRGGGLVYANGGHNPPLLRRAGNAARPVDALARTGPLLGVLEEVSFHQAAATLRPGDTLVLYTDGVTEAADPELRLYGESRLAALLAGTTASRAADLVGEVVRDVQRHSAGAAQADDITLLILRYVGWPA